MLKYLFILVILLPFCAFCQKGSDLITFTPTDTTNLYEQVLDLLKAEKIKPQLPKDDKKNFVGTKAYAVRNYNSLLTLNFRIKDDNIPLFGYYNYNSNVHKITSDLDFAWQEMVRLGKKLGTAVYGNKTWQWQKRGDYLVNQNAFYVFRPYGQ